MLGIEAVPAMFYFFALFAVPESPRWLVMHGRREQARAVLSRVSGEAQAASDLQAITDALDSRPGENRASIGELWRPAMRLVVMIGVSVAILQQITGINAVFFYAPTIFGQAGAGADASFMQAALVGLVNLVFTVLAMLVIDRVGRRPLLCLGVAGIAACLMLLAYGFGSAKYTLHEDSVAALPRQSDRAALQPLIGRTYGSDVEFRRAVVGAAGVTFYQEHQSDLVRSAISMNATLVLAAILGFVASFAVSLGPVMWVLFSELFPNKIRGIAISFVGLINSAVSFAVQLLFPWELQNLGSAVTFMIYGMFAIVGLVIVVRILPETKGRSLEELEAALVKA